MIDRNKQKLNEIYVIMNKMHVQNELCYAVFMFRLE